MGDVSGIEREGGERERVLKEECLMIQEVNGWHWGIKADSQERDDVEE